MVCQGYPKQHGISKNIIFVSNFFSGCQWSPGLHSPCLGQRSEKKQNYIDLQQLANSPVLCLRPDWKVVIPSLVQINLCLPTFIFNYSAAHILNHNRKAHVRGQNGLWPGSLGSS